MLKNTFFAAATAVSAACGAVDLELFGKLVSIPSASADIAQVGRAQEAMKAHLEARGVSCTMETLPSGRKVLYASTRGEKNPDFILSVHLDVVPGNPGQYGLEREGDTVRGRGVRDCKGSCVAVARVLETLNGKASVGAIFGADEEIGGASTRFMVEKGYRPRKMTIVADGPDWNRIAYAQKGHVYFQVTARGKGGHSSRPWEADDSITRLARALAKLRDAWDTAYPLPEDKWQDVLSVTFFGADGGAFNRIPDEAKAVLNLRSIRPDSADKAEAFIRSVTGLEVKRLEFCQPFSSDPSHPLAVALRAAVRAHIPGEDIPFARMNAATDARCFHDCGVPVMVVAIRGGGGHSADEWADLPSIDRLADILVDFLSSPFFR